MLEFINYLLIYNNYIKYRYIIKINKDTKELVHLYDVLDVLMAKYSRDVTLAEYKFAVLQEFPDYQLFLEQLEKAPVSQDMLQEALKQIKERSLAYDLALLSVDVSEGRKELSSLLDFYSKFEQEEKASEDEFVTDDLELIYSETFHKPGLRWRLQTLNRMLGSLRRGNFGFLFARPETGKTTFLASEVTYFAGQAERPILWFNNEEDGLKVKTRIMQAALGCSLVDLYKDRKKSYNKYMEVTKGNIKLKDSASIHKRQVEALCKEYKPSLVIFDQIDKIKGFDSDREDLRLGSIYIWARELSKLHCPIIGVSQADVTGEGKKWLTMDNVANAKTSKQAEADWILGIGKTHDQGLEYVRYLHLSKNKLNGDSDSDPELRHGRVECLIEPNVARYKDFN